jgi:hypothetical protein
MGVVKEGGENEGLGVEWDEVTEALPTASDGAWEPTREAHDLAKPIVAIAGAMISTMLRKSCCRSTKE